MFECKSSVRLSCPTYTETTRHKWRQGPVVTQHDSISGPTNPVDGNILKTPVPKKNTAGCVCWVLRSHLPMQGLCFGGSWLTSNRPNSSSFVELAVMPVPGRGLIGDARFQ